MIRSVTILMVLLIQKMTFAQSENSNAVIRKALVQYGEENLVGNVLPTDSVIYLSKLDSLIKFDEVNVAKYQTILTSFFADEGYTEYLIDSLLESSNPPYDLINELQKQLIIEHRNVNYFKKKDDITGNSEFPSHQLYLTWDSKKIWNHINYNSDTTYVLQLEKLNDSFCNPVCKSSMNKYGGFVSSKMGWRNGKMHNGIDIHMDQWDSVLCAFNGKVRFAKEYEGFGKVVVVRHYNGLETVYAHLAKIKVKSGQNIKSGDLIGLAGSTGKSEGSHLHFEMRFLDCPFDPSVIFDFKKYQLKSTTFSFKPTRNSYAVIPESGRHVIERGDYPVKIAKKYGISLEEFYTINNIDKNFKFKIGDEVIIK